MPICLHRSSIAGAVLQGRLTTAIKDLRKQIGIHHGPFAGVVDHAAQGVATGSHRPLQIGLGARITLGARGQLQITDAQLSSPKRLRQPQSKGHQSDQKRAFHR